MPRVESSSDSERRKRKKKRSKKGHRVRHDGDHDDPRQRRSRDRRRSRSRLRPDDAAARRRQRPDKSRSRSRRRRPEKSRSISRRRVPPPRSPPPPPPHRAVKEESREPGYPRRGPVSPNNKKRQGKGRTKEEVKEEKVEEGEKEEVIEKEEPNFEVSGLLAEEDNSKNGVPLKFVEPPDAQMPTKKWRLYIFKKGEEFKVVHIHRQAGFLFGKDRRVADVPIDHQTCSKQHAVLHFRTTKTGQAIPYIMDLESTNGTFLNGSKIEPARYVEMREKDVLKFALSTREFVLLNTESAGKQSF